MATGYGGPNPKRSGSDPRGRVQNQSGYQQQRYENQQGPFANELARNFGRAAETQYGDYNDIMSRYGQAASGGMPGGQVSYSDPFNSYGGYTEFSQTGGYSPTDIANMRARGTSPVRAAYANAQREIGRGRSLQGGYSPNAAAAQVKMAREQGQSGADAMQNVEAGLAEAKNRGRLAGLSGMAGIEGQRLDAQLQAGMFNAREQNYNQQNALNGMANLYGTTPAMAATFGNQLNQSIGQAGQQGMQNMANDIAGMQLPGAWEQNTGRIGQIANAVYPWLDYFDPRKKQQQQQIPGAPINEGYGRYPIG
jgi:hypothetical protein